MKTDDARLLDLARRLLSGEAIDWEKEGIAESEVREGMKRLRQVIGSADEDATATAEEPTIKSSRDHFIGPFRIVRKLGEGGMGVVYEAEQQRPKRPVALKVIRGGRHVDDHALRLFQREIQTLARLSHPGIAQLYETGATDDGMHFFAMELIRGVPLSEWLKKRSDGPITPAEMKLRLGVFRKICDAVAYAHQKGVIHRDLKPGNILIPTPRAGSSIEDAVPEVKILDFGLARMTDTDVQMTTYVTEMGKVQGTLPYMSPEQVRGNPDEIDLRTDVYSLGVILYEMVTGHLPYDLSKLQLPEAVRVICEETPRSLGATFTGTKRLDADVATIAGKCLEKETARRYQSAAALSEDVQRYLSDQPILARPPSAAYQFRKLVLRHKGSFAAAAGAFVLLIAFSIAMTVQTVRISREAETSRRVSEFLESLFEASNPMQPVARQLTLRDVLQTGAERIATNLKDEPKIQARLMKVIALACRSSGLQEGAALLNRALELTESAYGRESVEYADALSEVVGFDLDGQLRAHAIRSRLLPPDDPRMARGWWRVGVAKLANGQYSSGEDDLKRALDILDNTPRPDQQVRIWVLNDLGLCRAAVGDYRTASTYLRRSVELRDRVYHELHPDRIEGLNNLGFTLILAGERTEARRYLLEALAASKRAGGDPWLIEQSLGELERLDGNLTRARELLEKTLADFDAGKGDPWNSGLTESLYSLGLVEDAEGHIERALKRLGQACQIYGRQPGIATHNPCAECARVLRKAGRITEAEKIEGSLKPEAAKP